MGMAARGTYQGIFTLSGSNTIAMLTAVPLAMAVYAVLIVVFRAVTEDELPEMPFGSKLLRLFKKLHMM